MALKASLVALALSAVRVQAQEFKAATLHSSENCDPDPNDLEALTMELAWNPQFAGDDEFSGCYAAQIIPKDWPAQTENGKYSVWVDTSKFGNGCSMLFYNLPGSPEQGNDWACNSGLYRQVQKDRTSCGDLDLTQRFGYAYCCGNICNQDIHDWPIERSSKERRDAMTETENAARSPSVKIITSQVEQRREAETESVARSPHVKDVTKAKRAPVFEKRQDNCIVNIKEGKEPYTTYGRQIKVGREEFCQPDQTSCGEQWSWSSEVTLSTSTNVGGSIEVGWSHYVTIVGTVSWGFEFTTSETDSRTTVKTMAPEPGHAGYATFTPLYVCADAELVGDCSRESLNLGNGDVCVQKFLPGDIPDGKWEMVITD